MLVLYDIFIKKAPTVNSTFTMLPKVFFLCKCQIRNYVHGRGGERDLKYHHFHFEQKKMIAFTFLLNKITQNTLMRNELTRRMSIGKTKSAADRTILLGPFDSRFFNK